MTRLERHTLELATKEPIEIVNISDQVRAFAAESESKQGLLHISSAHTTLGLAINESCDKLQQDMQDFFARLAPADALYRHNRVTVDGRPNAHSHLLSLMLQSQLTLVLDQGALDLGPWQAVFAIELDGPRENRKINLTLMGM